MSYERRTVILDGIATKKEVFNAVAEIVIEAYSGITILQNCAEYWNKTEQEEITVDEFWDYLCDMDYIIQDDFMNKIYIGRTIYSISDDTESCVQTLDSLPLFPNYSPSIAEFLEFAFPKFESHRFLINYSI